MPYYSAITNPIYMPAVRDVTSVTNGFPAVVTTSFPHSYLNGLIVRMVIPFNYGMFQLNDLKSVITVLSDTTFSINIDTTNFDVFAIPTEAMDQPLLNVAQSVPIGELASHLDQSFVNILTPQF